MMGLGMYEYAMFGSFVAMLVGLLFFHHHKNIVVLLGFLALSGMFINHMEGVAQWLAHFNDPHRKHLLIDLALLIPAFALVAHYFEHSGASYGLASVLRRDSALLWTVFVLSIFLDNIAAALIGATILLAKYGKDAPFRMIIGCIGASNLGGAGSPVGDTTTVMMFISKDPKILAPELFMAFIATIPAMFILSLWAVKHGINPQSHTAEAKVPGHLAGDDHSVHWRQMWPILAIPGLIIGNMKEMPGIGVWAGLIAGLLVARIAFNGKVFKESIPNMLFLVTLVGTAEMLPLDAIKPQLERIPSLLGCTPRDVVAVLMGFLSPWFDNIPLTAICLKLGGFDWGLLAYCVGYGGSAMWFGSSAGVAMGLIFPQTYDTKRWGMPFVVVTVTYLIGVVAYQLLAPFIEPMIR